MRKHIIIFIFALLHITYSESMLGGGPAESSPFDLLLLAVENGDSVSAKELINAGAPAAIASDISEVLEARITGVSYKPECISLDELAYLTIVHYGFDDAYHVGEMIVNRALAQEIIEIFTELLQKKYPIERMELIDNYDADDDRSMEANNSSALCCRAITNKPGFWSKHSYGIAIDINPVQNPYIRPGKDEDGTDIIVGDRPWENPVVAAGGGLVLPRKVSREYVDRSDVRKGMIIEGDVCHKAFKSRGWEWGGDWGDTARIDYQHFEKH